MSPAENEPVVPPEQLNQQPTDVPISSTTPGANPMLVEPAPALPTSQVHPPAVSLAKKSPLKKIVLILVGLLVLAGAAYGGYYYGTRKATTEDAHHVSSTVTGEVTIPKDATVTAECVEGRGKQYVIPKDIPDGPIYDMHDSKVVAVEFLVNFDDVIKSPEKFMDLALSNGMYDHIAVMPMDAHAGLSEKHVHVIAYTIPAKDAEAIKCTDTSTSTDTQTSHMH